MMGDSPKLWRWQWKLLVNREFVTCKHGHFYETWRNRCLKSLVPRSLQFPGLSHAMLMLLPSVILSYLYTCASHCYYSTHLGTVFRRVQLYKIVSLFFGRGYLYTYISVTMFEITLQRVLVNSKIIFQWWGLWLVALVLQLWRIK